MKNSKVKKKIMILGCGPEQITLIKKCRTMGYFTIGVDDSYTAAGKSYTDKFINTKIKDKSKLLEIAKINKPDAIISHAAELSIEISQLTNALGLAGNSIESAINTTLKDNRLIALKKGNINIPKFKIINADVKFHDLVNLIGGWDFPFVIKPNNSKGAFGVQIISSKIDLKDYFDNFICNSGDVFIIEELLTGKQFSTESIFYKGEVLWNAIAYRHYEGMHNYYPYLIEDGHSMPVSISTNLKKKIISEIVKARKVLKIRSGVLKGDIIVDKYNKVYIIELASRTSGGRFADFVTPLNCGVNILDPIIQISLGLPPDKEFFKKNKNIGVSQRFIFLEENLILKKIPNLKNFPPSLNLEEFVFTQDFLTNLTQRKITCHRDRIGYVICSGKTREEADKNAIQSVKIIKERILCQ